MITYLKFAAKNVEIKTVNQHVTLLGLKIIDYVINAKNVKNSSYEPINELIKRFSNAHKFCNNDLNKFILLLRNGVYLYEYMDSLGRFDETSLPDKEPFYSELYLEDITDKDYAHVQKVFEELKLKKLGDYHDLYVKVIHYCWQMYLKTLETSVLKYMNSILLIFVCTRISMASLFRKTAIKLELLTNIDMLLMVEKGI